MSNTLLTHPCLSETGSRAWFSSDNRGARWRRGSGCHHLWMVICGSCLNRRPPSLCLTAPKMSLMSFACSLTQIHTAPDCFLVHLHNTDRQCGPEAAGTGPEVTKQTGLPSSSQVSHFITWPYQIFPPKQTKQKPRGL